MCQPGRKILLDMIQDMGYLSFCFRWISALFGMIRSLCAQTVCFLSVEVGSHAPPVLDPQGLFLPLSAS